MQEADEKFVGFLGFDSFQRLDQLHVFGSRTFLSTSFGERDSLAFLEFFVTHTFDAGMVEKQVLVRSDIDEAETLVRQSLDRTFCHFVQSLKKCLCGVAQTNVFRRLYDELAIVSARLHGDDRWRSSRCLLVEPTVLAVFMALSVWRKWQQSKPRTWYDV